MVAGDEVLAFDLDARDLAAMSRLAVGDKLLRARLDTTLHQLADEAKSVIESHMHFDKGYATGELESSLYVEKTGDLAYMVGTDVAHAAFVEFGTGQRGAASGVEPGDGYSYGDKPGMEAEPYMAPGMAAMEPLIEHALRATVSATIEELAHG